MLLLSLLEVSSEGEPDVIDDAIAVIPYVVKGTFLEPIDTMLTAPLFTSKGITIILIVKS